MRLLNFLSQFIALFNRFSFNIATTALISGIAIFIALPKSDVTRYDVDTGKPWPYPLLIAPFELPVKKSAERIQQEKDSTRKDFAPYFELMTDVAQTQIARFEHDYQSGKLGHYHPGEMTHAVNKLKEIYRAGVISSEDMNKVQQDEYTQVQIVVGTTSTLRETRLLLTKNSAREYLLSDKSQPLDNTLVSHIDNYININLSLNKEKSEASLQEALNEITPIAYLKPAGAKIIDRGEIVTPQHQLEVESFNDELNMRNDNQKNILLFYVGRLGLIFTIISAVVFYLSLFRHSYLASSHKIYLIFSLITLFCIIASVAQSTNLVPIYAIPFVMVPIVLRIFTDSRTAFIAHVTTVMLVSFSSHNDIIFFPVQVLAGLLAVFTLSELSERSQILRTAAIVTVGASIFIFFFELSTLNILNRNTAIDQIIVGLNLERYRDLALSGVALLFTYPLLYLIERIFGFTSAVTLVELSNINNPILRRLAKVAQGTFVHSMQVGNLAAEVADKIGGDVLLVRTSALYHDIGKMLKPDYFTENQDRFNPHDNLTEQESAAIIIGHVTEGLRLAEKAGLPKPIRDIIQTHHGRSLVKYFYIQAVNKLGKEQVDENDFRYPGPNPTTLEQAIIMMADSVEAASRSLKEHTEKTISDLVNNIIDAQMADGVFNECPITFRDISQAKDTLIKSLMIIYHNRIAYPELNTEPQLIPVRHRGLFPTSRETD